MTLRARNSQHAAVAFVECSLEVQCKFEFTKLKLKPFEMRKLSGNEISFNWMKVSENLKILY